MAVTKCPHMFLPFPLTPACSINFQSVCHQSVTSRNIFPSAGPGLQEVESAKGFKSEHIRGKPAFYSRQRAW